MTDYDVICVGGGLGGAALAKGLAEKGARVLVLERETEFRDRNRGELLHPWGVAEARQLGLYDLYKETCGHEVRYRISTIRGGPEPKPRDLVATSPHQLGSLHFFHPEMQEVTLEAAASAGANVRRGITVTEVIPGDPPSVRIQTDDSEAVYPARLVVGADGRGAACRKWGRFEVKRDADRLIIAGVLFNNLSISDETYHNFINPPGGEVSFQIPLGKSRFRCYVSHYQRVGRPRLSGPSAVDAFIEASAAAGAPREWFEGAEAAGPLSSFDCAENWVTHPYRQGIALIGDAAATSDPTFGCGLSLTLRDARVLRDHLLESDDWEAAANAYAAEHDTYFESLHRLVDWLTDLFYAPGERAAAQRERALARVAEDPKRLPDLLGLGPEFPSDMDAYHNLFGEDGGT